MKITRVENEKATALLFVGKKYKNGSAWGEWWKNGWFGVLEKMTGLSAINDDGYIGLMRDGNNGFEYWIGMFFDEVTDVADEFEVLELADREFAVFHVYGNESKGEIYGKAPTNACIEIMKNAGLKTSEDSLRFERYNCPRYTTPDKDGNVILDYAFAIK